MAKYLVNFDETKVDWVKENRYVTDFVKKKNYEIYQNYLMDLQLKNNK